MYVNKSQDPETLTNKAAHLGGGEPGTSSVATTTKHPRHRPGCSCIVCIQPPSGKGKHKPTCLCNVCMTVKRRFKTLMMRKKKRQSEREAEIALRNNQFALAAKEEEAEVDSTNPNQVSSSLLRVRSESDNAKRSESEIGQSQENEEVFKGGLLDLNRCPVREDTVPTCVSMMSLVQEASLPLDSYLKQNGLTSLAAEITTGENTVETQEEHSDEVDEKDQRENDPS